MQRVQLIKWFLLILILFCIPLLCLPMPLAIQTQTHSVDPTSYSNIISNLRNNWQSPITYLKKRGYIPVLNEHFDEKRSSSNAAAMAASAPASASAAGEQRQTSAKFADHVYAYDKALRERGEDLLDSLYNRANNRRYAPTATPKEDQKDGFMQNMKEKFLGFFGGKKTDLDKTQFTFNLKTDGEQEMKAAAPAVSSEKKVSKNAAIKSAAAKSLANNRRQLYDTSNQRFVLMDRYM